MRPLRIPARSTLMDSGTNRKPIYDFLLVITYIRRRTVSKLLQIIGQICAFDMAYTLVLGESLNSEPRNVAS